MDPLEALGLAADATEQDAKRAYARRLKQCRPDEDAAGFQTLNETYQAALSTIRWRAQAAQWEEWEEDEADSGDDEGATPSAAIEPDDQRAALTQELHDAQDIATHQDHEASNDPATQDADAPRDAQSADADPALQDSDTWTDINALADEILSHVINLDGPLLQTWLEQHPQLWSLVVKQEVRWPIVQRLQMTDRFIRRNSIQVLVDFFELESIAPDNQWLLAQLEPVLDRHVRGIAPERPLSAEEEAHRQVDSFDARLKAYRDGGFGKRVSWIATLLTQRPVWWKWLLLMLLPGLPRRATDVIHRLRETSEYDTKRRLNPTALDFWSLAGDPTRLSVARTAVVMLRMILLLFGVLILLNGRQQDGGTSPIELAVLWAGIGTVLWLLYGAFMWLRYEGDYPLWRGRDTAIGESSGEGWMILIGICVMPFFAPLGLILVVRGLFAWGRKQG